MRTDLHSKYQTGCKVLENYAPNFSLISATSVWKFSYFSVTLTLREINFGCCRIKTEYVDSFSQKNNEIACCKKKERKKIIVFTEISWKCVAFKENYSISSLKMVSYVKRV